MMRDQQTATTARADPALHGKSSGIATIPFAQRLTCTIDEACEATGLGRTKLYELIGGGHIDTITIGRRRLVQVRSLLQLVRVGES